jgi:hypothetical protein
MEQINLTECYSERCNKNHFKFSRRGHMTVAGQLEFESKDCHPQMEDVVQHIL